MKFSLKFVALAFLYLLGDSVSATPMPSSALAKRANKAKGFLEDFRCGVTSPTYFTYKDVQYAAEEALEYHENELKKSNAKFSMDGYPHEFNTGYIRLPTYTLSEGTPSFDEIDTAYNLEKNWSDNPYCHLTSKSRTLYEFPIGRDLRINSKSDPPVITKGPGAHRVIFYKNGDGEAIVCGLVTHDFRKSGGDSANKFGICKIRNDRTSRKSRPSERSGKHRSPSSNSDSESSSSGSDSDSSSDSGRSRSRSREKEIEAEKEKKEAELKAARLQRVRELIASGAFDEDTNDRKKDTGMNAE